MLLCGIFHHKYIIMFIKIEPKSETEKAYQLQNGSWIPKSILDNRGLKHPYYKIEDWRPVFEPKQDNTFTIELQKTVDDEAVPFDGSEFDVETKKILKNSGHFGDDLSGWITSDEFYDEK